MANTAWGILGAVASGERMSSSLWTIAGKIAVQLPPGQQPRHRRQRLRCRQRRPSTTRAPSWPTSPPGTPSASSWPARRASTSSARLYSYQDMIDGSPTKGQLLALFVKPLVPGGAHDGVGDPRDARHERGRHRPVRSPQSVARGPAGCRMAASPTRVRRRPTSRTRRSPSRPSQPHRGTAAIISAARQYLKANQNPDGGFPYAPHKPTDGTATAAVIQAIVAMGEHQYDAFWQAGGHSPAHGLAGCSDATGGYADRTADAGATVDVTGWALVALSGKAVHELPEEPGPGRRPASSTSRGYARPSPRTRPSSRARAACSSRPPTRTAEEGPA